MTTKASTQTGIEVRLIGSDSNAFAILGATMKALKKAERAGEIAEGTAKAYQAEATAGDYDRLLATTAAYVEIT